VEETKAEQETRPGKRTVNLHSGYNHLRIQASAKMQYCKLFIKTS